jgi:hypothetical protein
MSGPHGRAKEPDDRLFSLGIALEAFPHDYISPPETANSMS